MKRSILAIIGAVAMGYQLQAGEPTTVWPYLYDDFVNAQIYNNSGEMSRAKVNVHLLRNDLHYLNNGRVYKAEYQNEVTYLLLDDSTRLVRCENCFIEVLGETPQAIVGRRTTGDYDRLTQGTGAYGTSSTTSATNELTSAPFVNTPSYQLISNERENGQVLPVTVRYCFVVNGEIVLANKKNIARLLPETERKEFDLFLKTHKIKWKEAESLRKVLDYISPRLAE